MVSLFKKNKNVTKLRPIVFCLLVATAYYSQAQELTSGDFIKQLKQHYKATNMIDKFSVTYKSSSLLGFGPQSYDFNHPESSYRRRVIDVDTNNQAYFTHLIRGGFPGGFLFNTKEYQHDKKRYSYDVNGVLYGKRVFDLDTKFGYQSRMDEINEVVDVFAVKDMLNHLNEISVDQSKPDKMANEIIFARQSESLGAMIYTFQMNPIQLKSLYNEKNDQLFNYKNHVFYDGIEYASQVLQKEEHYQGVILIESLVKQRSIDPMKLRIPEGYGPIIKNQKKALVTEMIAKDLYLISNISDRYIAFKVTESGIIVFGAPGSDKHSEAVIAHIKQQFPMKKIKSVYITHHHNDHIGGLNAYAQKGVTILADAFSISAIKAYKPFAENIAKFKFRSFEHKELIDGVRFYIPENSHAKGQSFAYFEQSQIIYEGDLLEIPFDNTIANYMSEVEKQFVEFVRKENLAIKRIIGHHRNGNISPEVMNAYYQANEGKAD
jgi:glyoxylase-like metal-dependent hydrolase (beta-lactamase superfamily II)